MTHDVHPKFEDKKPRKKPSPSRFLQSLYLKVFTRDETGTGTVFSISLFAAVCESGFLMEKGVGSPAAPFFWRTSFHVRQQLL
jgi:hypothetical protein